MSKAGHKKPRRRLAGPGKRQASLVAVTLALTGAIAAAIIGFTLGLFFGLIAGYFRDTWVDKVATSVAIAGVSVPHYWLGMVLVIIFSVQLNWLPAVGAGSGGSAAWAWDWDHMKYLVLPAITTSVWIVLTAFAASREPVTQPSAIARFLGKL